LAEVHPGDSFVRIASKLVIWDTLPLDQKMTQLIDDPPATGFPACVAGPPSCFPGFKDPFK
jgi:hypothetical protein